MLEANFLYADLVLAGFSDTVMNKRLELLEFVVEQKPTLYRGIMEMADLFVQSGQYDEAQIRLARLISIDPYIEDNYGVINAYMNDVLTGASHQVEIKQRAELLLKSLS